MGQSKGSVCPSAQISRATILATFAASGAFLFAAHTANACDVQPSLHIEVTTRFDAVPVRTDYALADIAALARKQNGDAGPDPLGFYATEFGYTIDVGSAGDAACPARIDALVTLMLQHRVIEIGREAAENACTSAAAMRHYHRLAEVDEQTVASFGPRTAATLERFSAGFKQIYSPDSTGLDAALRDRLRSVVDNAIISLHDARRDAQHAVNDASGLKKLASSCSI